MLVSVLFLDRFRESNNYEVLHHELYDLIPIMKISRKYDMFPWMSE
jgi:hypothetical protein